jgi:hypothetical protein
VCTKGRDVINASWWLTLTRNSSFKTNNCNNLSQSWYSFKRFPKPHRVRTFNITRWLYHCNTRAAQNIEGHHRPVVASIFHSLDMKCPSKKYYKNSSRLKKYFFFYLINFFFLYNKLYKKRKKNKKKV